MWLNKCLKKLASEHLATANMLSSLKPCTTALPSYCFITLPKRELEKIRLTVSQILGVFANTLTADDNIPFVIGAIYRNQFNCNYLRNKKFSCIFCCISEVEIKF